MEEENYNLDDCVNSADSTKDISTDDEKKSLPEVNILEYKSSRPFRKIIKGSIVNE